MRNTIANDNTMIFDRMGRFIGQLRDHEGVTLSQLSHGLCSVTFLNRIENGEREIGKQMTDAFFQRLGKPVELFERILDWDEFQQWSRRQEIITALHHGDTEAAEAGIKAYLPDDAELLDLQFAKIIEINCRHLSGADARELLPMVCEALELTQPGFQTKPVDELLLSQNEGRLLFAHLQLREQLEGFEAVSGAYRSLLRYFKHPRYESRERVYLFPYVACQVIENDYRRGDYASALEICGDALNELTKEKRLFAYDLLLEWKQKLLDVTGDPDKLPGKLLEQLKLIQTYAPKQVELLVPCDERGHVYCLNHVIRDRRRLLGISQEVLAEGICEPRTLSRIETKGGNLQKKNRKLLLQRVNMSGERYDYEVITDRYEDYLLRSELDRALTANDLAKSSELLSNLQQSIPSTPTNHHYIFKKELDILVSLPENHPDRMSFDDQMVQLQKLIQLTLPLDVENIHTWSPCVLSVNEMLSLIALAFCYKKQKQLERSLNVLSYIDNCFKRTGISPLYYEGLYTRVATSIASVVGDLGRYSESNSYAYSCIKLSLDTQTTRQLARCLYGISWNYIQQLPSYSEALQKELREKASALLKQAYAAALISGDKTDICLIKKYYFKINGSEVTL